MRKLLEPEAPAERFNKCVASSSLPRSPKETVRISQLSFVFIFDFMI